MIIILQCSSALIDAGEPSYSDVSTDPVATIRLYQT